MAGHRREVALILPEEDVEDEEVNGLARVFESYDFHLTFATPSGEDARGNGGMLLHADTAVDTLDVARFDILVVVGCRDSYPMLDTGAVREVVAAAVENGLVVAGVCEAVRLLAEQDLLEDAEVALPKNLQIAVREKVGSVCGDAVCHTGTVFTGKGGDATEELAEAIVDYVL